MTYLTLVCASACSQVDVGVGPEIVADIMAAMRAHADANASEYSGSPFVQVGLSGLALSPWVCWGGGVGGRGWPMRQPTVVNMHPANYVSPPVP